MNIDEERSVEMVEFPIELSEQEANKLYEYGLKLIVEDKNEVINYAVNSILKEMIAKTENNIDYLKDAINQKKGKKNDKSKS